MNKMFQTITSVLIIVLLFLLMWVFISYYTSPVETRETNFTINNNVPSPDIQIPITSDIDNQNQLEKSSTDGEEITKQTPQTVTDTINEKNPETSVIISSSPNTSNAEKQQVLNEIDEALSELLLVVDSVRVVDETRLGIEEGVEVQP